MPSASASWRLGLLGGIVSAACACDQRAPASPSNGSGRVGQVASASDPASSTDAGAQAQEPAVAPFRCNKDALFEPGRTWTEERTTSATSSGPGGYMGRAWEGVKTTEQRLEKQILALEGEKITRMQIRFVVDRDPERGDENEPKHRTPYEGKTAILVRRAAEIEVEADTTSDGASMDQLRWRANELAPEMTAPRWRGEAPALATTFRKVMGWDEEGNDWLPGAPTSPWGRDKGTATLAPTSLPAGSPFTHGRAFALTGDAREDSAGLGHGGVWKIHVTGMVVVSPEGALVESRLKTRSVLTERLNHGCGRDHMQPCPWSVTLTTTTTASFRVICDG